MFMHLIFIFVQGICVKQWVEDCSGHIGVL